MRDQYFVVTTYVTRLGYAFIGIPTTGLTIKSIIELAKEIELRLIRQGVMPDFYQMGGVQAGGSQSIQYTTFQLGPPVSREALFSMIKDNSRDTT